ncbi:PTS transporter subunit EIIC [Williamsoniiplasma lucivorax]|uniref:PTS system, beta-glucoside-specific IIABC component n=1 Tax=Williamsoniiplasma lucivorax TaxID=209274 RepID=A0A2S5RDC1_9MOLU|nr:PTS transporter subunit EIIC [Williamsoniiplasma lucivorax]PPE05115.1 PTS system, beta-glucoside-specific IIABC component [Williamsoniiplasma lucivorax]
MAQKKDGLVKGINWLGNELQVIIGMEVPKVFDAFNRYLETVADSANQSNLPVDLFNPDNVVKKEDLSFATKTLNTLKGFMLPMIPAVIGMGIIVSLQAILVLAKVIPSISQMTILNRGGNILLLNSFLQQKAAWLAGGGNEVTFIIGLIFYIGGTGAMQFLGVLILINGFKYLKLNPVFGAVLGLMVCAPTLIVQGWSVPLVDAWGGWMKIKIGPVMGSIFVLIPTVFLFKYVKIVVDKIVPNLLNNLFAGAIALFITTILVFVALGPVIGIFENILGRAVSLLTDIPYGLGVMFYAFAWQFLVITGAHVALVVLVMAPWLINSTAGFSVSIPIMMGSQIAAFGQMGAGLGVAFRTKDKMMRKTSIDAAIPCLFGVTEPMIFGVTLIKIKALVFGCVGAAIGGLVFGLLGSPYFRQGGLGILAVMNTITGTQSEHNGGTIDIVYTLLCFGIATLAAFLITAFFFEQDWKVKTKQSMRRLTNLTLKYIGLNGVDNTEQETLKNELSQIEHLQSDKIHIKNQEEYLKQNMKYDNLIAKMDKIEIKLIGLKEKNKNPQAIEKLTKHLELIKNKIVEVQKSMQLKYEQILPINNQTIALINQIFATKQHHETLMNTKNNYINLVNKIYKGENQQEMLEEVRLGVMIKEERKQLKANAQQLKLATK